MVEVVRRWARETPERPALTFEGQHTTWAALHNRASRLAHALAAEGVAAQDRVAILDKNTPAHFDLLFGAALLDAVYVAVNWRLAPPEIVQVVNDSEAKVLIVGAEFVPQLEAIADQLTGIRRIVIAGAAHDKYPSLAEWTADRPATDPGVVAAGGDVAMQLYTSGTTGLPKGVMLTNDNLAAGLLGLGTETAMSERSVSLVAMPLFHIGGSGWAVAGMAYGLHTVLLREVVPGAVLDAIKNERVTHAFLVPAVLMFLLGVPTMADTDFSSLQYQLYGASPISEDVLVRCMEVMRCKFIQVYGLTETTGAITILRAEEHDPGGPRHGRLRSCGVPFDHIEIRIADPTDGTERPVGEVGELWTRSPQNMAGYWHKPDETARTITPDGWLRTGDAGYKDDDGFIYLHDRIKDMIVSGGENIYPAEVENALMSHPSVADAAVIGVPSERWGETVKAIVVAAPGASPTAEELIEHCRDRVARYKCPTSVDFADALPRNPSGKILKRELREPYWEGRSRQIQ
jgi:long-chain acyl-CoA synthetase